MENDFFNPTHPTKVWLFRAFFNGTQESAGDCQTLTGFPPTEFHLGLGDYIMEAFGRIGFLLDRLTLIVHPSQVGDYPSVYSAGGPFGAPFDAMLHHPLKYMDHVFWLV